MSDAVLERGGIAPSLTSESAPEPRQGRRLQRPRTKGYRTPPGVIYAGRPGPLANPFEHRRNRRGRRRFAHARSVELHRAWLGFRLGALELARLGYSEAEIVALDRRRRGLIAMLPRLRGADIECWCPLSRRWCHVDTIIRLAAASEAQRER